MSRGAGSAGAGTPSTAECLRILTAQGVPDHIRRHSERVAQVVRYLRAALEQAGEAVVGVEHLEAAALLHDVAKMPCIESRRDHALEGGRVLRELGLPEVAALVEQHVRLGPWDPSGSITAAELLNYCDKRVCHEEVVGLAQRFEDLLVRYGAGRPEVDRRIRDDWAIIRRVEEKVFRNLPVSPEQVTERLAEDPTNSRE